MKNLLLFPTLVLFLISPLSYSQNTFQFAFSGTDPYAPGSYVIPTLDSGYLAAGATTEFGVGNFDALFIRLDKSGDTLWTKTYGTYGSDGFYSVQQTKDSGFIATGYTTITGATDIFLVKTNSNGDVQWHKSYGGTADMEQSYSVQQTTDGGYIVEGFTRSFGAGQYDVFLLKVDQLGNLQWSKAYGGANFDNRNSVKQTYDGGYILAGQTLSFGTGGDLYLLKTDSVGNLEWSKNYGGTSNEFGCEIQITSDSNYIIVGYTSSFGAGDYDIYVIKTDTLGDTLWTKAYGGSGFESMGSIQELNNSGFIISGSTMSFGAGNFDFYLISIDSTGEVVWSKTMGGHDEDQGTFARRTYDGGFICAGITKSFGLPVYNLYLIKTDSLGQSCSYSDANTIVSTTATHIGNPATITTTPNTITNIPNLIVKSGTVITSLCPDGINENENILHVEIFPNPTTGKFSIVLPAFSNEKADITVSSLIGNVIYKISSTTDVTTIDLQHLPDGIYLVQVDKGQKTFMGKIIKQ